MQNAEMRSYMRDFVSNHGNEVALSVLLKDFKGFEPQYSKRGTPKDEVAARSMSITRSVLTLQDELAKAFVQDRLNYNPDVEGHVDFSDISQHFGGDAVSGNTTLPDYLIKLDESFFVFVQSLGYTIGGSKSAPQAKVGTRSPNSQKLYEALKELEKSNGPSAKKFLEVYNELQETMKLPRLKPKDT